MTVTVGGLSLSSPAHTPLPGTQLGPAGERLLRSLNPGSTSGRRNYREPSRHFVKHTLTVAELAVQAIETARTGAIDVVSLEAEPDSWQRSLGSFGAVETLKPDLRLVTTNGNYENHWFIEADLASEHLPVILRQCAAYETYRASGRYQALHGLFPAVLWVTPTPARAAAIRAAVAATPALDPALFRTCATDEYLAAVTGDPQAP